MKSLSLLITLLFYAVSAHGQDPSFNEELQVVDAQASFQYVIDNTYSENEWSIDGFVITAGSEIALEHGASEALHAMGFRFYSPYHSVYPSLLTPPTLTKQEFYMPYNSVWLAYGIDRRFNSRYELEDGYARWQTLNNISDSRKPAGSSWQHIISSMSGEYDTNPSLLRDSSTFELDDPTAYAENVRICSDYFKLPGNLNEYNRANFDPADGDTYPSEKIFQFALDVVNSVKTTIPNAQLGLYAYAGHRLPVNFDLPGIYIQVALAFNQTDLTYQELVEQHGAVADEIMLREYFDTEVWSMSKPMSNNRNHRDYYTDSYPDYVNAGVIGTNGEFQLNWLANLISINHAIRFMKTGQGAYQDSLDEIVANIYNNDLAVKELYELWSNPNNSLNAYTLAESFQIVSSMVDSDYKNKFMSYLLIVDALENLGEKTSTGYHDRLEALLSQIHAVTLDGIIHSYALQRRLANGNVSQDFPDLWMYADPLPNWIQNPLAPNIANFESRRLELAVETARPPYLDDEDLVIADVQPTYTASADATAFTTQGNATFLYIGPGTVTHNYNNGTVESIFYGSGVTTINISDSNTVTTWDNGMLFLDMFPQVRKDPSFQGDHWLYVPSEVAGNAVLTSEVRITIYDESGRLDITSSVDSSDVGPGHIRVSDTNTRGIHSTGNINRYLSPYSNKMLMPKTLALADGLTYTQVFLIKRDLSNLIEAIDYNLTDLNAIRDSILTGDNSQHFTELSIFNDAANIAYIEAAKEEYSSIERASMLDSYDLVLAETTPLYPAQSPASAFTTRGLAKFVFVGPGDVTHAYKNGSTETKSYDEGTFMLTIDQDARTSWTTGKLFLNTFPEVWLDPSYTSQYWWYIPHQVSSNVILKSKIRITVYTPSRTDIYQGTDTSNIETGQVMVADGQLKGEASAGNTNKYLSPYADLALMPKQLAEMEGLVYTDITPEGWTTPEILLEHLDNSINALSKHRESVNAYQFK